ncbi:tetratricopeptide repeat protein [Candidatus Marinimicrobia bacterium]|nr:tetratricopeptide repeat protein [Candidatus Neomarinimicrobiota bacterium]
MSKLSIYALFFLFSFSFAQDKGIELFNDKKYSEAIEYYKKVLKQRKGDAAAELGLGSSAYYNDNIDLALMSFEEASKSDNEIIQSKALYNIARILQDKDEISKSLKLYKKALELNPSDVDTKINYELLKKMKNQEQQENQDQEGSQEQQENQDQEGSSADNIEKEKSDQKIQAEAILNALKGQEEINQKQKILKSKILKYEKDW